MPPSRLRRQRERSINAPRPACAAPRLGGAPGRPLCVRPLQVQPSIWLQQPPVRQGSPVCLALAPCGGGARPPALRMPSWCIRCRRCSLRAPVVGRAAPSRDPSAALICQRAAALAPRCAAVRAVRRLCRISPPKPPILPPPASSMAPYPSFCPEGQKLGRSASPPFPTKPSSAAVSSFAALRMRHTPCGYRTGWASAGTPMGEAWGRRTLPAMENPSVKIRDFDTSPFRGGFSVPPERGNVAAGDRGVNGRTPPALCATSRVVDGSVSLVLP